MDVIYILEERNVTECITVRAVSSASYGTFALLCGVSIFFLIRGKNLRSRRITHMLLLTLATLFISTTIYTIVNLIYVEQGVIHLRIDPDDVQLVRLLQAGDCARTAALTINIILGDAIVCWRAYVVWKGNRFIMSASMALLVTTLALATVDAQYTCTYNIFSGPGSSQLDPDADGTGTLYEGLSYGVAASVLSLSTNLYATTAVALKAWQSRRTLRPYIVLGPVFSQTGKVLSLLVESGTIYCAIWVLVVAYQTGMYSHNPTSAECLEDISCQNKFYHSFWYIFGIIMVSCLVPLIAIYPTIIIILVALNRSHMEHGFMKANKSDTRAVIPLPQLVIAVNTSVTTRCESGSQTSSEFDKVLDICAPTSTPEDGIEGSSTYACEKEKSDTIV